MSFDISWGSNFPLSWGYFISSNLPTRFSLPENISGGAHIEVGNLAEWTEFYGWVLTVCLLLLAKASLINPYSVRTFTEDLFVFPHFAVMNWVLDAYYFWADGLMWHYGL